MEARGTWSYNGKSYKLWRNDLYFTLFGKRYHYYKGATLAPAGFKWIPRVKVFDFDFNDFNRRCYAFEWLWYQYVIAKEK